MKRYLVLVMLLFGAGFGMAQQQTTKLQGPVITFEKTTFDFGDITQGDKVTHTFVFTNTGNEPLIITDVQRTCGCTVPKFPRSPVPPGQSGEIVVTFDSTNKVGKQNKPITVISNAANADGGKLSFTTNVLLKSTPQ